MGSGVLDLAELTQDGGGEFTTHAQYVLNLLISPCGEMGWPKPFV